MVLSGVLCCNCVWERSSSRNLRLPEVLYLAFHTFSATGMLLFQVINYRVCKLAGGVVLHDCYLGESYFPLALRDCLFPSCSEHFSLVKHWGHELTVTVTLCDGSVWGETPKLKARGFRQYECSFPFFDEGWLESILPQAEIGLCELTSVSYLLPK